MPYSLGLDFGTESARALLVDCSTGDEVAQAVAEYSHGVIDEKLPTPGGARLKPDSALQNPDDYIEALKSICSQALSESGVSPDEIIGVGVDFTASTIMPCKGDGTPLCGIPEFRENPHSWVKLWKHHGAAAETEELQRLAERRSEKFLAYFGGALSSEWLLPKALEILREAPELFEAAELLVEAGDWLVWQLTGELVRNKTAAGYKGMWVHQLGYPAKDFLRAVDSRIEHLYDNKAGGRLMAAGECAGLISESGAKLTGLRPGVAVSAATIDAHAGVPGCGVVKPGAMVVITGTSQCHMLLSERPKLFQGFAGLVWEGIIGGYYGYESGQTAVGDIYAWFVNHCAPAHIAREAEQNGRSVYEELEARADELKPGEAGVLALDWWKGNRSVLMDARLSGLIAGLTLDTRPEHIYRGIVESTVFGTRRIVESYPQGGVPVNEVVMCGGLIERSPMFGQISADALNRRIKVAASSQTVALGSAMFGAVAAGSAEGGFDSIEEAAERMVRPHKAEYQPNSESAAVYDRLYALYRRLHDHFGIENDLMSELRNISAGE